MLIADDHAVVRDGLKAVLGRRPSLFAVVGEAATVPAVLRVAAETRPDLCTLDLTMPGGSGLATLPLLLRACPNLGVVVLTMCDEPGYVRQAIAAGARGYLLKDADPEMIVTALVEVAAGSFYLQPELGAALAARTAPQGEQELSEREREVVRLAALGYTNGEIAQRLHIGERTVKTYRSRAMEKLGISRRSELVDYARREGLMEDPLGISARLSWPDR